MLRVLTLATLFPDASRPTFGGFVERQTLTLAARDDVQLEVVAPIGVPPWPLNHHAQYRQFAAVPEREMWKGVTVHRPRFRSIPKIGGSRAPAAMARAVMPVLRDIHERFPFDIIDAEFFYPDGPAAMRLAADIGVPFSVKARGADIHYWGKKPGCAEQVREAGLQASGLLAVSEALKVDMVALGMAADKITVHYTGIDKELFRPVDRAEAKQSLGITGPLIVTVGALIPRKGQAIVIDALRDVPDATLWCIGEGPDRPALEKQARALGLGERVRFPGNLPHTEVASLLATADVMALPSVSEGLANAWTESLACGTPIVISSAGGAAELIDRPEAGAITAREPAAIATETRRILADPPDQDAVRATVDRFSWERNSDALFTHLSRLVER
ncbi:glycosyltransferase [Parasphingopyxis sp.]|uniref:glycosyltransferase n=1 Tax=Parasphingopyxis sp. TaxID=1920299 RepID=UPI0026250DEB|nr:glycosyltransferase [Parasphingopyxis sp.]